MCGVWCTAGMLMQVAGRDGAALFVWTRGNDGLLLSARLRVRRWKVH